MKNKNLIALHSQESGGKDVTAEIIQMLTSGLDCESIHEHIKFEYKIPYYSEYKIKKFATPLKQICAILTGTELRQWEDREFKETPLDSWKRYDCDSICPFDLPCDKDCQTSLPPRQIMQDVGEAMRNINPDVFVNALFRDYIPDLPRGGHNPNNPMLDDDIIQYLPSWIISDLRFSNELQAIQKRNGILVKIERDLYHYEDSKVTWDELNKIIYKDTGEYPTKNYADLHWKVSKSTHHSENSLNHFKDWDYVLDNSKDIPHLINEVEKMLKYFKVI